MSDAETRINETVTLESDFYPLTISMGQYEFFMKNGRTGLEAMELYMHLQYTARLQKTNQIWANNAYLKGDRREGQDGVGLGFGDAKIKTLKSFLHKHGLIEYVQANNPKGTLNEKGEDISGCKGKQYIRLKYIHKMSTIANSPLGQKLTARSETEPLVQETAPPVNRTTGSEKQMLKVNKEMLEIRNGKEDSSFPVPEHVPEDGGRDLTLLCAEIISLGQQKNSRFRIPSDQREQLEKAFRSHGRDKIFKLFQDHESKPRKTPIGDLLFFLKDISGLKSPGEVEQDERRKAENRTCEICGGDVPQYSCADCGMDYVWIGGVRKFKCSPIEHVEELKQCLWAERLFKENRINPEYLPRSKREAS